MGLHLYGGGSGGGGTTGAQALTATAVKTANYTAAAGDLVPVDATSGAVTVTLPTAPADKTRVAVKKIDSSTNAVTIQRGGSDVFNKAGGSTSGSLTLTNQATSLQYAATGGIWYAIADDVPLSQLDARYSTAALGTSLQAGLDVNTGRAYVPTGYTRLNQPRTAVSNAGLGPLSTGRLTLVAIWLQAGDVVTNLTFASGTTAAGTPTHQWFALYDASRNKLAVTSDDTTTAWGSTTTKTLALTSPYTVTASGLYYAGILVTATTVPQLAGTAVQSVVAGIAPIMCGASTTGLTDPASAPATAAALTTTATFPIVLVS